MHEYIAQCVNEWQYSAQFYLCCRAVAPWLVIARGAKLGDVVAVLRVRLEGALVGAVGALVVEAPHAANWAKTNKQMSSVKNK